MSPVCALCSGGFAGHLRRSWVIALNSDSAMCLWLGMDRPASPETFARGLLLGRALEVLLFGEPVSLVSMGLCGACGDGAGVQAIAVSSVVSDHVPFWVLTPLPSF